MLKTEFSKIGLNERESEVYLAILKAGKITPSRASEITGVNRTTIYSISRKLERLGLISEDLGQKVSYLVAEPPEAVKEIFREEERKLGQKKRAAAALVKELAVYRSNQDYSIPKIKFVEEEDLNEYLYKRLPEWAENGKRYDNTWWGFHDHSFTEAYKKWIDWCWKQVPDAKIRFFTNQADIEAELAKEYPERLIRPIRGGEFDSSLWVVGDYILMVRSRERPHYLVEIHDAVLARNQRQLFKSLWSIAAREYDLSHMK